MEKNTRNKGTFKYGRGAAAAVILTAGATRGLLFVRELRGIGERSVLSKLLGGQRLRVATGAESLMAFHLTNGSANAEASWRYIRPEPGWALVNLGDTIVEWTGCVLRSGLHRVVRAPGAQAEVVRRNFGYFLRPAGEARMGRLDVTDGEDKEVGMEVSREWEESGMAVDEWAARRAGQIIRGEVVARSWGGLES